MQLSSMQGKSIQYLGRTVWRTPIRQLFEYKPLPESFACMLVDAVLRERGFGEGDSADEQMLLKGLAEDCRILRVRASNSPLAAVIYPSHTATEPPTLLRSVPEYLQYEEQPGRLTSRSLYVPEKNSPKPSI